MLASSSGSSPWEVSDPSQEIREGGKEGGKGQGERKPFFVLLPLVAKSDLFRIAYRTLPGCLRWARSSGRARSKVSVVKAKGMKGPPISKPTGEMKKWPHIS